MLERSHEADRTEGDELAGIGQIGIGHRVGPTTVSESGVTRVRLSPDARTQGAYKRGETEGGKETAELLSFRRADRDRP